MEDIAQMFRAALRLIRQRPECASLIPVAELGLRMSEFESTFGELLKECRDAAELSVARLAKLAGLADNTIKNIEASKTIPTIETVARLLAVEELKMGTAEHLAPMGHELQEIRPNSYLTERYDPARWANDLRTIVNGPGCALEQSLLYLDNQSAADYLAVCDAYSMLRGALFVELQRLAPVIREHVTGPLHVIGIGSGDGRAEVCLSKALAETGPLQKLYLLDISNTLLAAAREHADAVLKHHRVEVETIHGNFHELVRYPMIHASYAPRARRLFTLFGSTLANLMDERRFFTDLHSCASVGDFVALDFQLTVAPADLPERVRAEDPALRAGKPPAPIETWQTGPLRRHSDRPFQSIRMVTELARGRIPGSYEVDCVAYAQFESGESRRFVLMRATRYDIEKLSEDLKAAGWDTLISWPYSNQNAGLLLLRRI